METKEQLRIKGVQLLKSLTIEERDKLSNQIAEQVFKTTWWKEANVIGITMSRKQELNTLPIIREAWKQKKKVAVPKSYPSKNNSMIFYAITDLNQLEKGNFGILEPNPFKSKPIQKEDINLMFVPGVLFDQSGYRIGYGGGYYDRYLHDFNQITLSLAMDSQILKSVQHEKYDVPVMHIVTEEGVIF